MLLKSSRKLIITLATSLFVLISLVTLKVNGGFLPIENQSNPHSTKDAIIASESMNSNEINSVNTQEERKSQPSILYEESIRDFDTSQGSADFLPVLMYHHLLPAAENIFLEEAAVLNLEIFEIQMAYLADQGFTALTLKETEMFLLGELEIPKNSILITFDDGYSSEAVYAADILRQYHLRAASFLITSQIEDSTQCFHPHTLSYLSWDQIQENRDVFEYAHHSHDMHHLKNGNSLLVESCEKTQKEDLRTSLSLLKSPYYAYPYGHKDDDLIEILKKKDYRMAFTTQEKLARPGDNLFQIGRYGITYHISFSRFQDIVHGH
ncbi:polysaccharide deacetylase family protein [Tindallia californiensis]|uniref:Polysaccharide deacetylase n=1 Tax=Tindallia californiensis TaxID=159292 RepID=A0A1H3MVQ6_9FIRM|nr:polysaccharide deacetylase family protein [Tindallia californiensis]SDY80574.1 Polysaccharide deacetylase [Tindallia californiensis]